MSLLDTGPGILDLIFDLELVEPLFWSEKGVQHQALPLHRGQITRGEELISNHDSRHLRYVNR